ncbi:MAG: alpha amylase C-terminal domain-containing protein, partial [Bacteroidota bacterium]
TLIEKEQCLMQPFPNKLFDNEGDQVVAFERAGLLFIFNFHPVQSYTDYGITVWPGKYIVALCTDNSKYGGFDRVDESFVYYTNIAGKLAKSSENHLRIYLPSRTAMVMKRLETKSVYD